MKRNILCAIIILLCKLSFGQSSASNYAVPKITPPSPDAAALGRFGDIEVDKGTGVPEINVPIYTIKTPRFNLPISLSYNATGIKVDQIATWVGLGWSLNAGGVINRTIVGYQDEKVNGSIDNMTFPQTTDDIFMSVYYMKRDYDPDYYYYNFNGHAGKFVFGQGHKPLQISSSPLKIQFHKNGQVFSVIDEKGDQYLFKDTENVSNDALNSMGPIRVAYGITSWYLSEMISADKSDTIKFSYVSEQHSLYENGYAYSQVLGLGSSLNPKVACFDLSDDTFEELSQTVRTSNPLRISEITFNGGKIAFLNKYGRLDEPTLTALRDIVVYNYNYGSKSYNKIKGFKFNHDHFFSDVTNPINPELTNNKYRLRLMNMIGLDKNNKEIQKHSFSYNSIQPPPVNNFAQDVWGYYNGKLSNRSLLQKQWVVNPRLNLPYLVGTADRTVDENFLQAGMLTSIQYPTKGYTQFNYEPHKYIHSYQNPVTVTQQSVTSGGIGAIGLQSRVFTLTKNSEVRSVDVKVIASISRYGNLSPPVMDRPVVQLIDMESGKTLYTFSGDPMKDTFTSSIVELIYGKQYKLTASAIGNERVLASIGLEYQYMEDKEEIRSGGGLRIASIKNFDVNDRLLTTDTYKYGINESGIGTTISPTFALKPNNVIRLFSVGKSDPGNGVLCFECINLRLICASSSSYDLSTLASSPIAYQAVTRYHGDKEINIGKTISEYDLFSDGSLPVLPYYQGGIMLAPNSWRNGQVKREAKYQNVNGEYKLKYEKLTDFTVFLGAEGKGMKVGLTKVSTGCLNQDPGNVFGFDFPIFTGVKLPNKTTETEYDLSGKNDSIRNTVNYYYDNLDHFKPTRIVTINSKRDTLKQFLSYPQDMVNKGQDPTGIYKEMSELNIVVPVIETVQLKNQIALERVKTNYFNTNNVVVKKNVESQIGTNPLEVRLNYQNYDSKGNLLVLSQSNGPLIAYQWGYDSQYPIAKATGTSSHNIFYEGFEEGKGNSLSNDAKTGDYSFTGPYSKALTGLDPGIYILSYWMKSGDNWNLTTLELPIAGSTFNIDLNGQIDELCFHPKDVHMTTYTYDALVGVTSTTDSKGQTTYYEYDDFQRLKYIKDQHKNIIKDNSYNYSNPFLGK